MWKLPRRLFDGEDAVDVDDFNETLYEFGSESGRLTDHNTDGSLVGPLDADRVARMSRSAFGITTVKASGTYPSTPIQVGLGWVVVETAEITMREGWLRVFGSVEVDGTPPAAPLMRTGLRFNGYFIEESTQPLFGTTLPVDALLPVPEGTHTVDLVVRTLVNTGFTLEKGLLQLTGLEK